MIEDIAPAIGTQKDIRILNAETGTPEYSVPESKISFRPFVDHLKQKLTDDSAIRSRFYRYLVDKFEAEPALLQPMDDPARLLNENQEILELLDTAIFPVISDQQENIFSLAAPYTFTVFNYSDAFRKRFIDTKEEHLLLPETITEEQLKQVQYSMLYEHALEKFYGIKLNNSTDLVYQVLDEATGMKRYYKIICDRRFIDIRPTRDLPDIKNCPVCLNTFRILNFEQQMQKMPPELFAAEGFAVWKAEDVTVEEATEAIKKILLRQDRCDTAVINELKQNIQALVGLNDIEVGLMPLVKINDQFVLEEDCAMHSLAGKNWKAGNPEHVNSFKSLLAFLEEQPLPMPVPNLDAAIVAMLPFFKDLIESGMRSYINYPMQNSDGLLGILEIGSATPNLLTHEVMARLEPVIPLLSLAMLKNRDAFNEKIEMLIKEKFTALQPSVEWKFAEVAWEYMHLPDNCETVAKQGSVVFDNVYPLYGAIDIRNSSVERSIAIQKDIKEHLLLIEHTLDGLQSILSLPLLEGLRFKNQNFRQAIDQSLLAEDEVHINEFFENEVEPVFRHLQKGNSKQLLDHYFNAVNDCNGYLHRNRSEYEITMRTINEAVLHYLEKEEEALQDSYPHYFEKYKTDGVEYNIYIGQSIAPNNPFDLLYLKNIRLWQLKSMAEIARLTHKLQPTLKVALQTTQLILVHNQPMAISFRRDERRFDVEGSYNIRYETMKKRLDKVHIKDSNERLTQPAKIAMVYSNPKEAQEYQEYITFLQSKNILAQDIEFLELESLQGISGLKALRVAVNLDSK